MRTSHIVLVLAALVTSGLITSADAAHRVQTPENPAGEIVAGSVLPKTAAEGLATPLKAEYQVRRIILSHRPKKVGYQLDVSRSEGFVRTDNHSDRSSEIWRRDSRREVSYQRVFHAHKRLIDYTSGDLKALGRYPDWQEKLRLVRADLTEKLQETGKEEILGMPATRYQGQVNGVDVELLWLEQLQLPATIHYSSAVEEYSMRLQSLELDAELEVRAPAGYAVLDYADLGDNEADPFVAKVLDAAEHGHHQH